MNLLHALIKLQHPLYIPAKEVGHEKVRKEERGCEVHLLDQQYTGLLNTRIRTGKCGLRNREVWVTDSSAI